MNELTSISVIVCTYKRIQWLTKCLRSLESQMPQADEIIVVDGPSTDGTRDMLELLNTKGELILIRQDKLGGISSARNLGLMEARSDVVCFIDDDAVAEPGWLESIRVAYNDSRIGGVGGPVFNMDGKLSMGKNAVSPDGRWFDESRQECLDGLYPVMVGCNMSFRRQILLDAGGFDPYFKFHQDETDACLKIVKSGYPIAYADKMAVRHEWCEGSYRKDRVRWYLKLRYLWGRNNSYLVRKHFGEEMKFKEYITCRLLGFLSKKAPKGILEKEETEGKLPVYIVAVGTIFEAIGLVKGWKDGSSGKHF